MKTTALFYEPPFSELYLISFCGWATAITEKARRAESESIQKLSETYLP